MLVMIAAKAITTKINILIPVVQYAVDVDVGPM
jgi:hypothetical protein